MASHFGVPISTTHAISACIMGVGASTRVSAVRWGVAWNIVVAWVLTLPLSGAIAFGVMNDLVGIWSSCFMLLFVIALTSLLWMHFAILRMNRMRHPGLKADTDLPEIMALRDAVKRAREAAEAASRAAQEAAAAAQKLRA